MKFVICFLTVLLSTNAIAQWSNVGSTHLTNTNTGNVGIGTGTTVPFNRLSVFGAANTDVGIVTTSSTAQAFLALRNHASSRDGFIIFHPNGRMSFNVDNSSAANVESNEYMTILNNGNIGINTPTPTTLLHLYGNTATNAFIQVQTALSGTIGGLVFTNDTGTSPFSIYSYPSGYASGVYNRANGASLHTTSQAGGAGGISIAARHVSGVVTFHAGGDSERMRVAENGNIGIGTTTPTELLSLHRVSSYAGIRLQRTGGNNADFKLYSGYGQLEVRNSTDQIKFVIEDNGNVGIGTDGPGSTLEIAGTKGQAGSRNFKITYPSGGQLLNAEFSALTHLSELSLGWTALYANKGSASFAGFFNGKTVVASGNIGTVIPANDLAVIGAAATNIGITTTDGAAEAFLHLRNQADGRDSKIIHQPDGRLSFNVDNDNGANVETNEYMTILTNGNIGIGKTNPADKLEVNGTIHAKEVRVDLLNWPDYVFENGYNLPTLAETKKFIDENNHLPGVPSASEVAANGVQLGEMNAILLKKIEELTLHLIELHQEMADLKEQLKAKK